eukprot:3595145-Alexandrium_andersonii.AAC.1
MIQTRSRSTRPARPRTLHAAPRLLVPGLYRAVPRLHLREPLRAAPPVRAPGPKRPRGLRLLAAPALVEEFGEAFEA